MVGCECGDSRPTARPATRNARAASVARWKREEGEEYVGGKAGERKAGVCMIWCFFWSPATATGRSGEGSGGRRREGGDSGREMADPSLSEVNQRNYRSGANKAFADACVARRTGRMDGDTAIGFLFAHKQASDFGRLWQKATVSSGGWGWLAGAKIFICREEEGCGGLMI